MILRHSNEDYIFQAKNLIKIPIINAGNGNGEHPTQALLDLYTIIKNKNNLNFNNKSLENINILFMGDIFRSRTVHSLLELLNKFQKINIQICDYYNVGEFPNYSNINFTFTNPELLFNKKSLNFDVIYITRCQDGLPNDNQNKFIVDKNFMNKISEHTIIMHPLPRNFEIDSNVDNYQNVKYFDQMKNGIYIRMALLDILINLK